jgi:HAD superfamily hydrolase (TIGR01549 family)
MAKRAFIFDIDDTLTDTTRANRRARRACLETILNGLGAAADQRVLEIESYLYKVFGWNRLPDLWRGLALELGFDRPGEADVERALALFQKTFFDNFTILPSVEETLTTLQDRGVMLGIISDGDKNLQRRKLQITGLERFFEAERVIVTPQSDIYDAKPSSKNLKRMEKILGLQPDCLTYVGDRPWDIAAARVAGWTAVRTRQARAEEPDDWPSPSPAVHKPDLEIYVFSEILRLI